MKKNDTAEAAAQTAADIKKAAEVTEAGGTAVELKDIWQAKDRLAGLVHKTSLSRSRSLDEITGGEVFLKLENMQKTGSFKVRGASNRILALAGDSDIKGVIAASAGNHAQGVALAATRAGIKSTIVMPEGAPISKIMATRGYGAEVVLSGANYDEAWRRAMELQKEQGTLFLHAYDDPYVIAGQGTIGLEIMEQMSELDTVLVPVGGGGLAAGVSLAVKSLNPKVKVIGVEAANRGHTIADGIQVKHPGKITGAILDKYLDGMVKVDDEEVAGTILMLLERVKVVTEGAGAASVAAALYQKVPTQGRKLACIVSGGNVDVNFVAQIIQRGMLKNGRYREVTAAIGDKPGSLRRYLDIIAKEKGNVINVIHDRNRADLPISTVSVSVLIETQGFEHGEQILKALRQGGITLLKW
ncbi:MAG: threonine ammonia-lyase [Peptococcaceae bacterium]|nr:threonine ammonia-lyase [Peptococcaceae bacterium]